MPIVEQVKALTASTEGISPNSKVDCFPVRSVPLNSGHCIPVIAYGTGTSLAWKDTSEAVTSALTTGLVHFDCAYHYKNQASTGRGISAWGGGREGLFVTTKGGEFDKDPKEGDVRKWLESCLEDLDLDYVDLYLIHADFHVSSVTESWKAMEQIQRDGLAKSIGVSNFSTKSLQTILDVCEIPPAVNQIEFHPYSLPTYLPTLLPLCKKHNVLIECYAPLMSIVRHPGGPVDDAVAEVVKSRGLGETDGQVLLMWAQQVTGGVVITTSSKSKRMAEQIKPFLVDSESPLPPLCEEHINIITDAGSYAPYRHWGTNWPYFMQGEGGIEACPPGSTWRNQPAKRTDLEIVTKTK